MIEFIETDIKKILEESIEEFEKAWSETTKKPMKLAKGSPMRLYIYTQALREYHLRLAINKAANMNLVKYSKGSYLEELGAMVETKKHKASGAKVIVRFHMSHKTLQTIPIPKATQVTYDKIFFETQTDTEIPSGSSHYDVLFICTKKGEIGNNIPLGAIKTLVDPISMVQSIENITESYGGSEIEDEESYRERIHMAPEGFSVAGPSGAYEKFAKDYSGKITDVKVVSPSPGVVKIIVLANESEPQFLDDLKTYLNDKNRRPLTDKVEVSFGEEVEYDIELTYYKEHNVDLSKHIEEYKKWQGQKLGRDINPSKLHDFLMIDGIKRLSITKPKFQKLSKEQIATCTSIKLIDGGYEDD